MKFEAKYNQKTIIEATKINKDEYKILFYNVESKPFEGILKVKDDNISFETTIENYTLLIEASEKNDETKTSIKATDENKEYIKVELVNKSDANKKIDKIDTSKAVNETKLTEMESSEIEANFDNVLSKSKAFQSLN